MLERLLSEIADVGVLYSITVYYVVIRYVTCYLIVTHHVIVYVCISFLH